MDLAVVMSAMAASSAGEIPAKSWQFRKALVIPICLSSANGVVMPVPLAVFRPEVNDPAAALARLDLGLKTLAAEQFNERGRQERRDNDQTFSGAELLDSLQNGRERLFSALEQGTDVESFELADGWHVHGRS